MRCVGVRVKVCEVCGCEGEGVGGVRGSVRCVGVRVKVWGGSV